MEIYNIVEDSALQKYIHDGAMAIIYRNNELRLLNHPFIQVAKEMGYNIENPKEVIIDIEKSLHSANIKGVKLDENTFEYTDDYFTLIIEKDTEGDVTEASGFTVHNVWEIEAKRLTSVNPEHVERANRFYRELR